MEALSLFGGRPHSFFSPDPPKTLGDLVVKVVHCARDHLTAPFRAFVTLAIFAVPYEVPHSFAELKVMLTKMRHRVSLSRIDAMSMDRSAPEKSKPAGFDQPTRS